VYDNILYLFNNLKYHNILETLIIQYSNCIENNRRKNGLVTKYLFYTLYYFKPTKIGT